MDHVIKKKMFSLNVANLMHVPCSFTLDFLVPPPFNTLPLLIITPRKNKWFCLSPLTKQRPWLRKTQENEKT